VEVKSPYRLFAEVGVVEKEYDVAYLVVLQYKHKERLDLEHLLDKLGNPLS
jgi:hypothetical protein